MITSKPSFQTRVFKMQQVVRDSASSVSFMASSVCKKWLTYEPKDYIE